MSEEPEFSPTREEFLDEFVHPDDRPALEEARQKRALWGTARSTGFDAPADGLFEDMLWARLSLALALARTPALPTSPNGAQ
jgi:hypothetical protein